MPTDAEVADAIWDLVWAGLLTNDTLGPLRVLLGGGQPRRAAAPAGGPLPRPRPGRVRRPVRLRPAVHADPDRAADGQRPLVAAARPR